MIELKNDGWNCLQEADPRDHRLEISCRTENGMVVEARIRHHDGEESVAKVLCDGKSVLPMSIEEFQTRYEQGDLDLR